VSKIRLLAIDDSVFVRKAIQRIFESDPEVEVAGVASGGREGVEKALALRPDVITLDVMMPEMDGLQTLRLIMEQVPTPVLMLSQLTRQGADLTLKALELGALDFVDKSSTGMMDFYDLAMQIKAKVRAIAGARPHAAPQPGSSLPAGQARGLVDVVAIGASTGGPPALQMILAKLPAEVPFGLLIVQHMPRGFTAHLAQRLDAVSGIAVREAEDGEVLSPGTALIAPAGLQMTVRRLAVGGVVNLGSGPSGQIHCPSANVLFRSVGEEYKARCIGVLLTGMGSDGADGLRAIRDSGGFTIAQDEATSAIYGMPRAALERGAVEKVLPVGEVAEELLRRA